MTCTCNGSSDYARLAHAARRNSWTSHRAVRNRTCRKGHLSGENYGDICRLFQIVVSECCLFNDIVGNSDNVALEGGVIYYSLNGKEFWCKSLYWNKIQLVSLLSDKIKMYHCLNKHYYYRYSALGPVWAETRVQSGDWYGSGTLHRRQVLRGSLPLLSPDFEMFPLFTTRCLHVCHDVRDPSCGSERSQRQKW